MAVPQLEGRAKEWWQKLISNAFFAPIYLLLIFVGLKVMEASRSAIGPGSTIIGALSNQTQPANTAGIFIIFTMMVAFMIGALMFAKSSGAAGAQFATSFATRAVQRTFTTPARLAVAPVRSTGNMLARNAIGGSSAFLGRKYDSMIGKMDRGGGFGKFAAGTLRTLKIDESVSDTLKAGSNVKFGKRSFQEQRQYRRERDQQTSHEAHRSELNDTIKDGLKAPAGSRERDAAAQAFQKMPEADKIATLNKYANDRNSLSVLGAAMSAGDYGKMMDNKDLNSGIQHTLTDGRFAKAHELKAQLDAAADDATKVLAYKALADHMSNLSEKDAEGMMLYDNDFAMNTFGLTSPDGKGRGVLSSKVRESLSKKESLTDGMRTVIKSGARDEQLKKLLESGKSATTVDINTAMKTLMVGGNMTKKEVAGISEDKFFNTGTSQLTPAGMEFVGNLNVEHLRGMAAADVDMSPQARKAILDRLEVSTRTDPMRRDTINRYLSGNGGSLWGRRSLSP